MDDDGALRKLISECTKTNDSITLHWFDILAIMIVGYWFGTWINGLWWF